MPYTVHDSRRHNTTEKLEKAARLDQRGTFLFYHNAQSTTSPQFTSILIYQTVQVPINYSPLEVLRFFTGGEASLSDSVVWLLSLSARFLLPFLAPLPPLLFFSFRAFFSASASKYPSGYCRKIL